MKLKKILCLILSLTLCLGILTIPSFAQNRVGFDNFKKVNSFRNYTFNDVKESDWFYYDVKAVYELGIMSGKGDNSFSPDNSLTIAEAIALVARLHAIYYGVEDPFDQTVPWYSTYIDYAMRNHYKILNHLNRIVEIDYSLRNYIDYNEKINGYCFYVLLKSALGDVYPPILGLYKARILNVAGNVTRSGAAFIINREILNRTKSLGKTN